MFSLFAAPPEKDLDWSEKGVEGAHRFLNRVWTLVTTRLDAVKGAGPVDAAALAPDLRDVRRAVHKTLAKVGHDYGERFSFNTAIAAVMELTNTLNDDLSRRPQLDGAAAAVYREAFAFIVCMLNPIVPHVTEELAELLGLPPLAQSRWPAFDPAAAKEENIELPVQVNGKLRGKLSVAVETPQEKIIAAALADPAVLPWVAGKQIVKTIVAAGRLVNIVVK
jgi:leucyl-tRNA synthetase